MAFLLCCKRVRVCHHPLGVCFPFRFGWHPKHSDSCLYTENTPSPVSSLPRARRREAAKKDENQILACFYPSFTRTPDEAQSGRVQIKVQNPLPDIQGCSLPSSLQAQRYCRSKCTKWSTLTWLSLLFQAIFFFPFPDFCVKPIYFARRWRDVHSRSRLCVKTRVGLCYHWCDQGHIKLLSQWGGIQHEEHSQPLNSETCWPKAAWSVFVRIAGFDFGTVAHQFHIPGLSVPFSIMDLQGFPQYAQEEVT